jgi:hypothetical protein
VFTRQAAWADKVAGLRTSSDSPRLLAAGCGEFAPAARTKSASDILW